MALQRSYDSLERRIAELEEQEELAALRPDLDGRAIMAILDIPPGPVVGEAYQFVATGNAELGFVALSQVVVPGKPAAGSQWLVPQNLHEPIRQDAVLLKAGAANPAAAALLAYLKSDEARATIQAWGYGLP